MFKVTRSGHTAISAVSAVERRPQAQSGSHLGTTSKSKTAPHSGEFESTSNAPIRVTGAPNTTVSGNAITVDFDPMLAGLTPNSEKTLLAVYRDMYYNDPVCGSAADLISTLPFSEFTLGGLANNANAREAKKVHDIYLESMERLNMRTLLPEVAIDYLVLGSHCSSLLYNRTNKLFNDILPHRPENLTVEPLPFYSQDPILTVKFDDDVKKVLQRTSSPRVQRIREHLGAEVVEKILSGSMELDPLSTLFLPRRSFSASDKGTSYFRRVLPIYLIEKNLFRGTLVESTRRQRGIMHLSLGDGEWVPSVQDMEFMTELFMGADSDPLGAIIATRLGVQVDEIRQGGDFWKSTDFADSVLSHKLRALGISEGFLSGEASYNTGDTALTVFVDTIRTFRDMITRKLMYNKLFPLISLIGGFTVKDGRIKVQENLISQVTSEAALYKLNDNSKLFVPTVHWTKQLKPEGDTAYMDMLAGLTEKGVPVPIRALAAAGGLDLDALLKQQDEDLDVRKRVAAYLKRIGDLAPKPEGEGDESAEASEKLLHLTSQDPTGRTRSSVFAQNGRRSILDRDFSSVEPYRLTKTGKARPVPMHSRSAFDQKANASIVKALKASKRK